MQNPYTQQVTKLSDQLVNIRNQIRHLEGDLTWYRQFSPHQALKKAEEFSQRITQRLARVEELTKSLEALRITLPSLKAEGAYGWNPTKWFTEQKKRLRGQAAECGKEIASTSIQISNAKKAVDIDSAHAKETLGLVNKYEVFDEPAIINRVASLRTEETSIDADLQRVKALHARVEAALMQPLAELSGMESQARDLTSNISNASRLDRDLSSASTSYDKAMAHQECERLFGDGSPRKMLNRFTRELETVDRNLIKIKKRIAQIGEEATRDIQKVVFDGSNLCIQNGAFIGLSALRTAVMEVAKRAKTVVVFDSSMRRRLKVPDRELPTLFGPEVTVHVTPGEADETILDLANDSTAFVVSNDRYADFKDKAVVKGGRVISHQIVDGKIFLRGGLGVAADVEQELQTT